MHYTVLEPCWTKCTLFLKLIIKQCHTLSFKHCCTAWHVKLHRFLRLCCEKLMRLFSKNGNNLEKRWGQTILVQTYINLLGTAQYNHAISNIHLFLFHIGRLQVNVSGTVAVTLIQANRKLDCGYTFMIKTVT